LGKYRDHLDIIADILIVARNGTKKTRIMHQANLSYKLLEYYLKKVLDANLAKKDSDNRYVITEKGEMYLELYKKYVMKIKKLENRLQEIKTRKEILERMVAKNVSNLEEDNCNIALHV